MGRNGQKWEKWVELCFKTHPIKFKNQNFQIPIFQILDFLLWSGQIFPADKAERRVDARFTETCKDETQ